MSYQRVKIIYDAAEATLIGVDLALAELIKETCLKWIDKSIEIQNQMWRSRGLTPSSPVKYCFDRQENKFPTGLVPRVLTYLLKREITFELENLVSYKEPTEYSFPSWGWEHQQKILDTCLENTHCIIQSPTASGKSTSISILVDNFQKHNVLIVVPSINLAQNLVTDLQNKLDLEIGLVGGGKESWQRVTVGVGRGLANKSKAEYASRMSQVDVLIVDEVHNYGNETGIKISKGCRNTSHRVGLSATVLREDGSSLVLEGVVGPTLLVIPDTLMVGLGVIHKPLGYFIPVESHTKGKFPALAEKPAQADVYNLGIVHNETRNSLIVEIALRFLQEGNQGSILILVEQVVHGDLIQKLFWDAGLEVPFVYGETKAELRSGMVTKFKQGEVQVLIASRILNEGEDIPRLELMINAAGGSSKKLMIQKTGRALRKDKSNVKTRAIIVDFLDNDAYYLNNNSRTRMRNLNDRHPNSAVVSTLEELYAQFKNPTTSATL